MQFKIKFNSEYKATSSYKWKLEIERVMNDHYPDSEVEGKILFKSYDFFGGSVVVFDRCKPSVFADRPTLVMVHVEVVGDVYSLGVTCVKDPERGVTEDSQLLYNTMLDTAVDMFGSDSVTIED